MNSVYNQLLILDKRRLRQSFERAAAGYDAAAVLQHEVCRRMLERLSYIRHAPAVVLDAGSGTGNAVAALQTRFPRAELCVFDIAWTMVDRARMRAPWWRRWTGRGARAVCGDIEQLPLRSAAIDMVWSNLVLQWTDDPQRACAEFRRVLAPGGLLMFSTFGPDTLKELRAAYHGTDAYTHVHRFVDMHDLGDALVHAGFADPVMDMETITLTYADVRALMRDLKAMGAHNATAGRHPGMSARSTLAAVERNYEALRRDGRLPATFEVVYGHAWVPQPRTTANGRTIIPIKPLKA
jgi:malonyl-CoA O-methyltransferase